MVSRTSFHQLSRFLVYLLLLLLAPLGIWGSEALEAKGFAGEGLRLFPLGWSSEGRWGALIYQSVGTERESFFVQVIDAVSDELLYRSDSYQIDDFVSEKESILAEVRKRFNLESGAKPDIRNPAFVTGGVSYTFFLDPSSPAEAPYRLGIRSSRGDVKDVYKSPPSRRPSHVLLLGAMLSPFEERALAVIREIHDGVASYRFSGAHLIQGFSAESVPNQDLVSAVMNGQEYLLQARLEAGSNSNAEDSRGYSVLLIAARLGNWNMVNILLDAGALPDDRDSDGRTALHHAAFAGAADTVRRLLAAGADRNIVDNAGQLPRDLSADATVRALLR